METIIGAVAGADVTQMASLLGEHDAGTLRHSWRVARLARTMAAQAEDTERLRVPNASA